MGDTPLVTTEVLATHFGVTVSTVRRWVRNRVVPCIRPSRRIVRFRLQDVERALTSGETNETRTPEAAETA